MSEHLIAKAIELFSQITTFEQMSFNESVVFEDSFIIANQIMKIRYGSQRLQEFYKWQMNLFRTETTEHYDSSVSIFCSDCMDELYSLMNCGSFSFELFEGSDKIDVYLGNGMRAGKNLFAWKETSKKGWVIISPDSLEKFIGVSFSLSPLLSRMSNYLGSRMLHVAAVVHNNKAVLISGLSGSGKSTLAAACLNYGMKYISDDTVLFNLNDGKVYPVCSTIHISSEVLTHLPKLKYLVEQGSIQTYPGRALKKHLDLSALSEFFVNGAPASLLICPKITNTTKPTFVKIPKVEALVPLLCSSVKLLGIHDNASVYMKGITENLNSLPTYRYELGPDLKTNVDCLLQFMKKGDINV